MDKARPGTWFTRGYFDDGVDKVQFDCCKEQLYCSLPSVRAFRHCPFCGCKLTNQRAIRPVSASIWKGTLGKTITPTYRQKYGDQLYWSIEWLHDYGNNTGSWREYSRVFCRSDMTYRESAMMELRQAIADAVEDHPWCDEHFRLVYRTSDRIIGVVQRPNWVSKKFVSEETESEVSK